VATSFEKAIAGFELHLDAGRGYSGNTVKAYLTDVQDLADFLNKKNVENIDDLTLEQLRDWLWQATQSGLTKATIARKSAAVRSFTAWALKNGLTNSDPGLRLRSPKASRTLPKVVSRESLAMVFEALQQNATEDNPQLSLIHI
jgi:integrase/recombinase XerC